MSEYIIDYINDVINNQDGVFAKITVMILCAMITKNPQIRKGMIEIFLRDAKESNDWRQIISDAGWKFKVKYVGELMDLLFMRHLIK